MARSTNAHASERGAVLVHVALALLALIAFSTFAVDYGVLWTARRQAQNAADAAAMSGAIGLAFDNPTDLSDSGPAKVSSYQVLMSHPVWGQQPVVNVTNDITFPACPDDASQTCVRVDVYRDNSRGNPLPMIFGQLVGMSTQGVRAMAMAKASAANASDCLKPWGLADKWAEGSGVPWSYIQTYDPGATPADYYIPPSSSSTGTSFTVGADYGTQVRLKTGSPGDSVNPGWFQPLDLTNSPGGGAAAYEATITGCVGTIFKIGDTIPVKTGNMIGPSRMGADILISYDDGATWDPTLNAGKGGIRGSCVETNTCTLGGSPIQYRMSPRVVAVPVFDLDHYMATGGPGNGTVRVVNILGFFVDGFIGNDIIGYLVSKPDLLVAGGGTITATGSFVKVINLIR